MHYLDEGSGDPVLCLHGEPTWSYPLPTDDPAARRRRAGRVPRLLRLRSLGQAGRPRLVHVRPPLGVDRAARLGARPDGADGRRPGLGRADRAAARRRAAGARRPARDPEHGRRRRPPAERRLAPFPRGRAAGRRRLPGGPADPSRLRARALGEPSPRLRRTVSRSRVEGRARSLSPSRCLPSPSIRTRDRCSRSATRWKGWGKPALVLFGDSDPIFPPQVADAIARHIPGALPAETVTNAGHFVQEDAGEEVAARIVRFLEES